MRTIFMGTPDIAVPALRLLAERTRVTCVITQPDRPAGRGHHLTPPPVKIAALELGIPVWQPDTLKGQAGDPRLNCDLAVVMAYGELLRQEVLDIPLQGCINLHASLLPRWRGASPLQAAIRAGDTRTGVTVMRMVRALDAGAMYNYDEIPMAPRATLPELHDQLMASASRALAKFLDDLPRTVPVEQDPTLVTTCHKLTAEHGRLDFSKSAEEIDRWVRAYTPAPGCWVPLGTERLKILAVQVDERTGVVGELLGEGELLGVGEVLRVGDRAWIGCGSGSIELLRIQAPSKKALSIGEYLRGHELPSRF